MKNYNKNERILLYMPDYYESLIQYCKNLIMIPIIMRNAFINL